MTLEEDYANDKYRLRGGIAMQNVTATQNLHEGTAYDLQPTEFQMEMTGQPALMCGVRQTSSTVNTVTAVAVKNGSDGTPMLAVTSARVLTSGTPSAVSVGVTDQLLLASNTSRRYAIFTNTSGGTVSLAFGATAAVLNAGVCLIGAGSSFEMSTEQGNLYTGDIRAIASAGATNVAIQESN